MAKKILMWLALCVLIMAPIGMAADLAGTSDNCAGEYEPQEYDDSLLEDNPSFDETTIPADGPGVDTSVSEDEQEPEDTEDDYAESWEA